MNYFFILVSGGLCLNNAVPYSLPPSVMSVVRFYSGEAVSGRALQRAAKLCPQLSVRTELCYNVELTGERPASCSLIITLTTGQVWFCKTVCAKCLLCFLPVFCRRRPESQRWAQGGSPLVVSSSPPDGAAVWNIETHWGSRQQAGGDRTEVPDQDSDYWSSVSRLERLRAQMRCLLVRWC